MKTLSTEQMSLVNGQGWGSVACKVGFGIAGAIVGGPWGAFGGALVGNMLCISTNAY